MIQKFPELKCIFPQPPVVAFRRNRNLKNLLVQSSFTKKFGKPHQPSTPRHSKRCKLCSTMSHSDIITDSISGKTCTITGGTCKTPDVIYAAECTFHNKLYIGHTSQPLNMRFNGHGSDAKIKPTACELAHHFHHNTCDFNKDLRVYILQDNVTGPKYQGEFLEDRWITRLDSRGPNGLNSNLKGELQRQNKLISSERPFEILQIETKIIKIGQAVLEIFNFKD